MNIKEVKDCILGSIVATMFFGLGFGIAIASTIPVISLCGLVMSVTSLIMMFTLLKKVKKAGYGIRMIKEGDEDEQTRT